MTKHISTQEFKTENGVFILQQEDFKITMTLVQDLNNELKVFPKPLSVSFDSRNMTYDDILTRSEELLNEAEDNEKLATAISEQKEMHIKYDSKSLEDEVVKKEFLKEIHENGRAYYRLDNQSVITICRPLLGFENKDEGFKSVRHEVEANFWKERIENEKYNDDIRVVAKIMLPLF